MFPPKRTIVFGHPSDPDQMVFDRDLAASADTRQQVLGVRC